VKLAGTVSGATLVSASATQGSCSAGSALDCTLGELAAGASVTVTAVVRAAADQESLAASADVTSDLGCEGSLTDNSAKTTLAITKPPKPAVFHRPAAATVARPPPGPGTPGRGCPSV